MRIIFFFLFVFVRTFFVQKNVFGCSWMVREVEGDHPSAFPKLKKTWEKFGWELKISFSQTPITNKGGFSAVGFRYRWMRFSSWLYKLKS